VKVSLVYPADATPGHLLSVVPVQQLALLHRRKQQQRDAQFKIADTKSSKVGPKTAPPPPEAKACCCESCSWEASVRRLL
jgi:hypothetical protein